MSLKATIIFFAIAGVLASAYYAIEPWAVTFVDDGPYYSTEFAGRIDEIPVQSRLELRRFGYLFYVIESRNLPEGDTSVLVLKDTHGAVKWARIPLKPDGELGSVRLRNARMTWYGGWRISIAPANQEGGFLYLGSLGGFRFFNHSW